MSSFAEGGMFLAMWIGYLALMIIALGAVLVWAVRAGQFPVRTGRAICRCAAVFPAMASVRSEGRVSMMMFNLYVQQNQWIVVTLLGWRGADDPLLPGILGNVASTGNGEQDGRPDYHERPGTFFRWILSFMPWALILIIISSVIFSVTHLRAAATHLPNW